MTVHLPGMLAAVCGGTKDVAAQGTTVEEVLAQLTGQYPLLRRHLHDDRGELRGYVNIFRNEEDVRVLDGMATRVRNDDVILIVPSVAGGVLNRFEASVRSQIKRFAVALGAVLVLGAQSALHAQSSSRVPKPVAVRGLYLNAFAAGSPTKLNKLLAVADSTEINTFVIDVKEGGYISYRSSVPLAKQIGATTSHIKDIKGVLAILKAHGVYPIARIVVFKDPVLANAKPAYAIKTPKGDIFHADDGSAWVDSYNREVWNYNIALAREAIDLGFSEVQWDYVRFPDVPGKLARQMRFPARAGRSMQEAIREFIIFSKKQLADLHVPVTADVFGATVSVGNDMGIGQKWERLVDVADVLLPMVYPSHYSRGSYGVAHPNAEPYQIVRTAMRWARKRTDGVPNGAGIRPWLQDFTMGAPRYGAAQVRAQMQAVYDSGLTEWVLWNAGSNYTFSALEHRTEEPLPVDTVKPPLLGTPVDSAMPALGPGSSGRPLDALPAPVRVPRDTTSL